MPTTNGLSYADFANGSAPSAPPPTVQQRPILPVPTDPKQTVQDTSGAVINAGEPGHDLAMDTAASTGGMSYKDFLAAGGGAGGNNGAPNNVFGFLKELNKAVGAYSNLPDQNDQIDMMFGSNSGITDDNRAYTDQGRKAADQYIQGQTAAGVKPGLLGSIAGDVVGTLPLSGIGGPGLQGLISGAMMSDDPSLKGRAVSGILGAFGGKAGQAVGNAVVGSVLPQVSKSAQTLLNAGFNPSLLTPGMLAGRNSAQHWAESAGQMVPLAGEQIRGAGNTALQEYNRVFGNTALKPIGADLTGATGHELFQSATTAKNAAYDAVGNSGHVPIDAQFGQDVGSIFNSAKTNLPKDLADRFQRLVQREFNNPTRIDMQSGTMLPGAAADIKAAINKEIGRVKNPSLFESDYVDHLMDLRASVTDALGRADPAAKAALAKADAAYSGYKTLENAVRRSTQNSTAPDGFFTPEMTRQAAASTMTPNQVATANSPLLDLARAGTEALPRKFKDVASLFHSLPEAMVAFGVGGTDLLGGHGAGAAMAIPALGAMGLYSRPVQQAYSRFIVNNQGSRQAAQNVVGGLLGQTGMGASNQIAAPALLQYLQQRGPQMSLLGGN